MSGFEATHDNPFPRQIVIDYDEPAYDALSEESLLTGMSLSTLSNRAAQVYKRIMDAQRQGKQLSFSDRRRRYGAGDSLRRLKWPGRIETVQYTLGLYPEKIRATIDFLISYSER
jgi:hypothetical protein